MRKNIVILILLVFTIIAHGANVGLEKGNLFPTQNLYNTKGELVGSTDDYRGKITIFNIGAEWCPPCKMEKPMLNDLYNNHKEDLNVVSIMGASSPKKVDEFFESNPIDFPAYYDLKDGIIYNLYITAFPTSYIVNEKGVILERIRGANNWKDYGYDWVLSLRDED